MLNTHIRDQLNAMFPIGSFLLRAANYATVETAVEGRWLQCNGVTVSRTTYAALFSYLNGLTPALPFGSGDGSTTFTLPDLRGRAGWAEGERAGVDDMGDSDAAAIANRGPDHYHTVKYSAGAGSGVQLPLASAADSSITGYTSDGTFTGSFTWTPGNILDKPAYLVVGSYFIKYTT
jgi:microcystin-dependent protein